MGESIPDGWMGLDCGPKSIENAKNVTKQCTHQSWVSSHRISFPQMIAKAKLIVWNGPQGVFEFPNFAKGSLAFLDVSQPHTHLCTHTAT